MDKGLISHEYEEVCRNHPEALEIFKLEKLMYDAGFDFWFNVQDDFANNELDDLFDSEYEYIIETQTGELVGHTFAPITVYMNRNMEGFKDLDLLDMRPARGMVSPTADDGELHTGLTAEAAMEIIEKFYKED